MKKGAEQAFLETSLCCYAGKIEVHTIANIEIVSPAYGYVSLALVKCSNEGGPGPRYNMKEVPGSSTLTMLVVHGYHLYLMPLFSEAGDWETSVDPLPPRPTWAKPPPSPFRYEVKSR